MYRICMLKTTDDRNQINLKQMEKFIMFIFWKAQCKFPQNLSIHSMHSQTISQQVLFADINKVNLKAFLLKSKSKQNKTLMLMINSNTSSLALFFLTI